MTIAIRQQEATPALSEELQAGFRRHALAKTGIDGREKAPVAFVATDDAGKIVGAAVVLLFWGQLHIKNMFVDEAARGEGLGARLMNEAHAYGRAHGCDFAFVETLSFQAEGFYHKLGYITELRRPGYAADTTFIYLKKDLKDSSYA